MQSNYMSRYSVDVPKSDVVFNETTQQAVRDVRKGRTFKAASVDDLLAQLDD